MFMKKIVQKLKLMQKYIITFIRILKLMLLQQVILKMTILLVLIVVVTNIIR